MTELLPCRARRSATERPDTTPAKARPGRVLAWLLLCIGASIAIGCDRRGAEQIEISGPTMGTFYSVKVAQPPPGVTAEALKEGIEAALDRVIDEISTYDPGSELSRFNQDQTTDWVPVSAGLASVVAEGLRISALSDGAFDITIGPLVNLWGFGPQARPAAVPDETAIAAALARVGYEKLSLREAPPALRKARGDIYVDLSALGEGYGADRVAAYLEPLGIEHYMVAVAGALRLKGHNARGAPWAIAIEEPTAGRRSVHRIIAITDGALSTSGDYRNFFEDGGQRYSHEIDPDTGRPVTHRLASVTVVDAHAMHADGLATALMVMGDEAGPELAAAQGIPAYFIVREKDGFSVIATAAFERYLVE